MAEEVAEEVKEEKQTQKGNNKKQESKGSNKTNSALKIFLFLVILVILLLAGYLIYDYYFVDEDDVLVKVGDEEITEKDYEKVANQWKGFYEYTGNEEALENSKARILDILIEEMIIRKEAEKRGIEVESDELEESYQELVDMYDSEEEMVRVIDSAYNGWTSEMSKDRRELSILQEKLSDEVLYDYDVRGIHMRYDYWVLDDDSDEQVENVKREITELREMLKDGKPYDEVVEIAEDEYFRPIDSPVGYDRINEKSAPEIFPEGDGESEWKAISALEEEGDISEIVDTTGFYIFFVVERISEGDFSTWEDFFEYKRDKYVEKVYVSSLYLNDILEMFISLFSNDVYALGSAFETDDDASVKSYDCSDCSRDIGDAPVNNHECTDDGYATKHHRGAIAGTVECLVTGDEISGVSVEAIPCYGDLCSSSISEDSDTTDSDGEYAMGCTGSNCTSYLSCWTRWEFKFSKDGYETENTCSLRLSPNGSKVNLDVKLTPKAECGDYDGKEIGGSIEGDSTKNTFDWDAESWDELSGEKDSNFCEAGDLDDTPDFPDPGKTASWECGGKECSLCRDDYPDDFDSSYDCEYDCDIEEPDCPTTEDENEQLHESSIGHNDASECAATGVTECITGWAGVSCEQECDEAERVCQSGSYSDCIGYKYCLNAHKGGDEQETGYFDEWDAPEDGTLYDREDECPDNMTCDESKTCYLKEHDPEPELPPDDIMLRIFRLRKHRPGNWLHTIELKDTPLYRISYPDYGDKYEIWAKNEYQDNPRYEDPFDSFKKHTLDWGSLIDYDHDLCLDKGWGSNHDFDRIFGLEPEWRYTYNLISGGQQDIPTTNSVSYSLTEGTKYTIKSTNHSVDRCEGTTEGESIERRFKVNHKPEVESIEPIPDPTLGHEDFAYNEANPNNRLSGNIEKDASEDDVVGFDAVERDDETFDCTVDNPKYFEVTFSDADGCEDIYPDDVTDSEKNKPGDIHPDLEGEFNRFVKLRAYNGLGSFEGDIIDERHDPISCDGNKLTVKFKIEFKGGFLKRTYDLQAKAQDILGNRTYENGGDEWVKDGEWRYSGRVENADLDVKPVSSIEDEAHARLVHFDWEAEDYFGIRFVRTYAKLNIGEVLIVEDDYSEIWYTGKDLDYDSIKEDVSKRKPEKGSYYPTNDYPGDASDVGENIAMEVDENESENVKMRYEIYRPKIGAPSRIPTSKESANNFIDIYENNDGDLEFDMIAVDRACNFIQKEDEQNLGAPWIATRGGHVYSVGNINMPSVSNLNYDEYSGLDISLNEEMLLGTEWIASGGSVTGHDADSADHGYISEDYDTELLQDDGMATDFYGQLSELMELRNPGNIEIKDTGTDTDTDTLDVEDCEYQAIVYFIDGDLEVYPENFDFELEQNGGCIFVVSGDITIAEEDPDASAKTDENASVPHYKTIPGFFIADGEINVDFVQKDEPRRDGLKVLGSLITGDGGELDNHQHGAFRFRRTLQLEDNMRFPTLIIFHDPRYMDIARQAFGESLGGGHIRDVGWME